MFTRFKMRVISYILGSLFDEIVPISSDDVAGLHEWDRFLFMLITTKSPDNAAIEEEV